jgi:hypothetical protein
MHSCSVGQLKPCLALPALTVCHCRPLSKEDREADAAAKRARQNEGTRTVYDTTWAVLEVRPLLPCSIHCTAWHRCSQPQQLAQQLTGHAD